jgi:hypothetical protein
VKHLRSVRKGSAIHGLRNGFSTCTRISEISTNGPLVEMRLLNVHTMRLEEYFGAQIPEYAILSHCVNSLSMLHLCLYRVLLEERRADRTLLKWGTQEVTFQHINDSEWRTMRGATKIQHASSYCKGQGLRHIWIDTCCIDKSSSAELSEAINSMYGWYEGSIVCYAYLEDVELALSTHAPEDPAKKDKAIRESRWFNKGWTLQELIAPTKVYFFDSQWRSLGSKEELSPLLSSITTIPEDVLARSRNRRSCSVARKMTWAANRQTTRIEDVAYSLLGIFDVNMPLLYGEGQKAFIRLQEEILKETDDQSLLAWGLVPTSNLAGFGIFTGVFATSPGAFLGSEDVVPIPSNTKRQPQSMTSRGVRIELPLWTIPGVTLANRYPFAILDCQYKNDFTGPIGIPLMQTRDHSIFSRNAAARGIQCPTSKFRDDEIRQIYISKRLLAKENYTERETLVIRARLLEDKGYDIFPIGSPPSLWDEKTKVLQMEYKYGAKLAQKQASAAIAFSNPGTKSCFIVMVNPMKNLRFQNLKSTPVKIFPGSVGADRLNLKEWVGEGQQSDFTDHWDKAVLPNTLKPSEQISVWATANREEICNQEVIVLSIDLAASRPTSSLIGSVLL